MIRAVRNSRTKTFDQPGKKFWPSKVRRFLVPAAFVASINTPPLASLFSVLPLPLASPELIIDERILPRMVLPYMYQSCEQYNEYRVQKYEVCLKC